MMPTHAAIPYITLSPAYRHAQRVMAQWLERVPAIDARRARVASRAAWTALDATERDRLVRWMAWLCVAAASRDDATVNVRLRQLDAPWGSAITHAMHKLPGQQRGVAKTRHALRLSA